MVLLHHVPLLNSKRLVLESASPRRSELLRTLGLTTFQVKPSTFDEKLDKALFRHAAEYAVQTALQKGLEVASSELADLVISADTIVDLHGLVLEKPANAAEAEIMISKLSGSRHAVHTGVALVFPRAVDPKTLKVPRVVTFSETTHVTFAGIPPAAVAAYVASGECYGKAGAYGIHGAAASFVSGIEGCFHNVVGFPLHRFSAEMLELVESGVFD